jgi:hypothetical protein
VKSDPKQQLAILVVLSGLAQTLILSSQLNLGDVLSLPIILVICVVAAPVVGFIVLNALAAILRWTGSWLGGQASFPRVRAAVAWSLVPILWILVQWVFDLALFREQMFTSSAPPIDTNSPLMWIRLMVIAIGLITGIWAWVVFLKCLSEVHRFSIWKALAATVLVWPVIVVPIFCLAIALIARALVSGW